MNTQISLDLSTLSDKQLNAFIDFVQSFLDKSPHFTPTYDESEIVVQPPAKKRKARKVSPESTAGAATPPAASGEDLQAVYTDLVQFVTAGFGDNTLDPNKVIGALSNVGVESLPHLSNHLDKVAKVRALLS